MHGTLCHDAVALLHSGEYFDTLTVALAKRNFLLAVAFGIYLDVNKVDALLLGKGCKGQRYAVGTVLSDEVNLGV